MVLLPRVAASVLNVLMLHPQVISFVKGVRLLVLCKHDPSPQWGLASDSETINTAETKGDWCLNWFTFHLLFGQLPSARHPLLKALLCVIRLLSSVTMGLWLPYFGMQAGALQQPALCPINFTAWTRGLHTTVCWDSRHTLRDKGKSTPLEDKEARRQHRPEYAVVLLFPAPSKELEKERYMKIFKVFKSPTYCLLNTKPS